MSDTLRKHLRPYEGQYVKASGYFSAASVGHLPHNRTACVEDCRVEASDGTKMDVHHVWVQYAGEILDLKPQKGQLLYFDAVVNKYQKRDAGYTLADAWSLSKPTNCEFHEPYRTPLLPPPVAVSVPVVLVAKAEPANPVKVLRAVKAIAAFGVGIEALKVVAANLDAIAEAVRLAGGADAFAEICELLN